MFCRVFGDEYYNAIEETWYKAAVLQRMATQGKESLVIATPLPILDKIIKHRPRVQNDDGDITVTASYAIFYKDLNISTPASVVGFQFSYKKFVKQFKTLVCHDKVHRISFIKNIVGTFTYRQARHTNDF